MSKPPNPQSPPSRPATLAESSLEKTAVPGENSLDALPPAPVSGPAIPTPTLAFPETQGEGGPEVPVAIPGYEMLGELGRGGMGVVYKARQLQLGRLVALKMSRSGDLSSEEWDRFRAEAEAVARLRHANIVQIFEVGECQGRPYFAFEYVDGGSLADFLRGVPQPGRTSAELVEKLARAIHVAHQVGIIHRDLKPANVLLSGDAHSGSGAAAVGGVPRYHPAKQGFNVPPAARNSLLAHPKIADFGVAKRLDKHSMHTATGAVLGTPNYMAPEQAWGSDKRRPIGPQADVYALGAILYEMITGRPPFLGETPLDTLQQVVMQEPVAPTRLQPRIPKDLETICLKCLQKEPARRYVDAEALADDLRRFLEDRPILAKPHGPVTRLLRWRRRNPAVAALVVVALVLLLTGTAVSTYFAIEAYSAAAKAEHNEREAKANFETARENARQAQDNLKAAKESQRKAEESEKLALQRLRERDRLDYTTRIALAQRALMEENALEVAGLLDGLLPINGYPELRGFEWYYMRRRVGKAQEWKAHNSPVLALAFSPEGGLLATGNASQNNQGQPADVEVGLWRLQTNQRLPGFKGHTKSVRSLAFRSDGQRLASASDDCTVKVWDPAKGEQPLLVCKGASAFTCVQFHPDGKLLLTASVDKSVRSWNADSEKPTTTLFEMPAAVECLAVDPGGRKVAGASRDGTVIVWDMALKKVQNRFSGNSIAVVHLAWHPKGKLLATASEDGTISVWDITTNERVPPFRHTARINQLAFSPDGNYLATASDDKSLMLFSATTLALQANYKNESEVGCLCFGAEGALLASGGSNGKVSIRPLGIKKPALVWERHSARVDDVCWNSDGTLLASCRGNKFGQDDPRAGSEVILWNTDKGRAQPPLRAHTLIVYKAAFQPHGKLLATASGDGTVRLWDSRTGDEFKKLADHTLPYRTLAWSPDGKRLAAACDVAEDGKRSTRITIWDVATHNQVLKITHPRDWMESLVWSPDGRWLAGASTEANSVWLWRADTGGDPVHEFVGHGAAVKGLDFSPDSRWLASASLNDIVRIWDVVEKNQWWALPCPAVRAVAFHPKGNRLATASDDKLVKLWDLTTQREVFTLAGHKDSVNALAFSPNGHQLATASSDKTVRIWDATPLPEDVGGSKD